MKKTVGLLKARGAWNQLAIVVAVAWALALGGCSHHANKGAAISRLVSRRLAADPSLQGEAIAVHATAAGQVVLAGTVATNAQIQTALADANILGVVVKVTNDLHSQQDLILQAQLQRLLAISPYFKGAKLRVVVQSGHASLQGTYVDPRQLEYAETLVRQSGLKVTDQSRLVNPQTIRSSRMAEAPIAPRIRHFGRRPGTPARYQAVRRASAPIPVSSRAFSHPVLAPALGANARNISVGGHPATRTAVQTLPAQPLPSPPPRPVIVPVGTNLLIRLATPLSSSGSQPGETFQGELSSPLVVAGRRVVPAHSSVQGGVLFAHSAGHFKGRSEIRLTLSNISYGGHLYGVVTSPWDKRSAPRGGNTAKSVGIGGAAGAILGGLFGGGKGAAIGAAIGAGGGAARQELTKPPEVVLPVETLLSFQLTQPLTVIPQAGLAP